MGSSGRFELIVPAKAYDSMLNKPKDTGRFNVNTIARQGDDVAVTTTRHGAGAGYTDGFLEIVQDGSSVVLKPAGTGAASAAAWAVRLLDPKKVTALVQFNTATKFIKLQGISIDLPKGEYLVHNDSIFRTPTSVIVVTTPIPAVGPLATGSAANGANALPSVLAFSSLLETD